jgi:hypothetical protein
MARAPHNAKAQNEKVDSSNNSDFNKFVKEYGPDLAMLAIPGLGACRVRGACGLSGLQSRDVR